MGASLLLRSDGGGPKWTLAGRRHQTRKCVFGSLV